VAALSLGRYYLVIRDNTVVHRKFEVDAGAVCLSLLRTVAKSQLNDKLPTRCLGMTVEYKGGILTLLTGSWFCASWWQVHSCLWGAHKFCRWISNVCNEGNLLLLLLLLLCIFMYPCKWTLRFTMTGAQLPVRRTWILPMIQWRLWWREVVVVIIIIIMYVYVWMQMKPRFIRKEYQLWMNVTINDRL
jgi:hypothetical protein